MTKEEIKEFDHLKFIKQERIDSIENTRKKIEKETTWFDQKIKHSRGLKREVLNDIKNDILTSYEDLIRVYEYEIEEIDERLEKLRGASK